MQQIDFNAQRDRVIFNKSQTHLNEFQIDYNIVEAIKIKCENDFHEKRQLQKTCKNILEQKRKHHHETKKNLNCVWNVYHRLNDIFFKNFREILEKIQHEQALNINDLIFKLKIKTIKIIDFETSLMQVKHNIEKIKNKQNANIAQHAKKKIE